MYKKDFPTYPSCPCPTAAGPLWVRGVSALSSQTLWKVSLWHFYMAFSSSSFNSLQSIRSYLLCLYQSGWCFCRAGTPQLLSVLRLYRQHPGVPVWCLPFPPLFILLSMKESTLGFFFQQIFEVRLNMDPYFRLTSSAWVHVIKSITWPAFT